MPQLDLIELHGEQAADDFDGKAHNEESLMELALEGGAEDVLVEGDVATVFGGATDFLDVKTALEAGGAVLLSAETGYVPQNTIEVTSKSDAEKILKLIDRLEDNEDVQNVYANYDIPEEWMEELAS